MFGTQTTLAFGRGLFKYYPVIVLALDTSTRDGSCALAIGEELRERGGDPGLSHAERLPGDLMALLDSSGLRLAEVDVFAVVTGPGSFTGLRVGIAAMQGLAFAEGKPLIGVSSFDALAAIGGKQALDRRAGGSPPPIATWIDAWRGEIFAALYGGGLQLEAASVEAPAAVLDRLIGKHPLFIGDAVPQHVDLIRTRLDEATFANPMAPRLAGEVARLAAAAAGAGHQPPPDAIRPLYVRRTDAELSRDARAIR
jgi:tRNA threonylcarbamoyladenosine biosynthesis protein TsaB